MIAILFSLSIFYLLLIFECRLIGGNIGREIVGLGCSTGLVSVGSYMGKGQYMGYKGKFQGMPFLGLLEVAFLGFHMEIVDPCMVLEVVIHNIAY